MFDLFKRKKPKTLLDELNATTASLYRPLLNNRKDADLIILCVPLSSYKAILLDNASGSEKIRILSKTFPLHLKINTTWKMLDLKLD